MCEPNERCARFCDYIRVVFCAVRVEVREAMLMARVGRSLERRQKLAADLEIKRRRRAFASYRYRFGLLAVQLHVEKRVLKLLQRVQRRKRAQ